LSNASGTIAKDGQLWTKGNGFVQLFDELLDQIEVGDNSQLSN